ncbi:MAG: hypothetical protein DRO14_05935, partial [Thermoprotei archaeon]
SVKLGREIRDYQRPLGIKSLVINVANVEEGLPSLTAEALVRMLKPMIYQGEPPLRSIEIVITGSGSEVSVTFICTSSDRPCGPSFKVVGVRRYE